MVLKKKNTMAHFSNVCKSLPKDGKVKIVRPNGNQEVFYTFTLQTLNNSKKHVRDVQFDLIPKVGYTSRR